MFVQVIRGKTKDPAAVRAADENWNENLKPGAKGYLGSTTGIADDGTVVIVVRFESEAAARANSERPEQGEWFANFGSKVFVGQPTFFDSSDIELFRDGGSDDAGFVQVMSGKADDMTRYRKMQKSLESKVAEVRPDVIGGITAWTPDGRFIDVTYFTSEADARAGEKKDLPADVQEAMQEFGSAIQDYVDLRTVWFDSA
jgi:heme-degrading monooxygenase HmoA